VAPPIVRKHPRDGLERGGTPSPTHVAADFDARVENKELKTRMRPVENSDAWRVRTALRLSSARGCALPLLEHCIHTDTQSAV